MQAVVKTPRIEITIRGNIPSELRRVLKEEYGDLVHWADEDEDEAISVFDTAWYQEMKSCMTPGDNMRTYRQNHGMTQDQLGAKLGGIPRQHISNMERGIRPISRKTVRKLSDLFQVPADKFI